MSLVPSSSLSSSLPSSQSVPKMVLPVFLAFVLACCMTLSLLLILASLTQMQQAREHDAQATPPLDFLLVKNESELSILTRQKPPEPEPLTEPDTPKPVKTRSQKLNMHVESIALERIENQAVQLDLQFDMSSALANLTAPSLSTEQFAIEAAFDASPRVLKQYPPSYPSKALRRKIEGFVVLEFTVLPSGAVDMRSIKVVDAEPKGTFERSVLKAFKRWKFQPKQVDGIATSYVARKRIEFTLN